MASDKEEMWSDVKNVVIKHVSDGNPVDYALAEYLGRTVFNDYRVRSFKLNTTFTHFTRCYPNITLMSSGFYDIADGDVSTQVLEGNKCSFKRLVTIQYKNFKDKDL